MGVLGLFSVCLWDLLVGQETSVCRRARIKHPALLQESQEGSKPARSLLCQLADDRRKKLTQLLHPTPLLSPKTPQRIKL